MHRLIQGAIPEIEIRTDLGHVAELDKLVSVVTEERPSMRNRTITVLARERGIAQSHVCSFLFIDRKTAARYCNDYQHGGTAQLFGAVSALQSLLAGRVENSRESRATNIGPPRFTLCFE